MNIAEILATHYVRAIATRAETIYRDPEMAPDTMYGTRSYEPPDWDDPDTDERETFMVDSAEWPSLDEQIEQEGRAA